MEVRSAAAKAAARTLLEGTPMRQTIAAAVVSILLAAPAAHAHHSFAVFFDDKTVEVTGAVTEFRFTNPHGLISIVVTDANGHTETWKVETNAQTLLRRRGWTKETLKIGEIVTVDGWLARDGSRYLRMRSAARADGTILFGPPAASTRPAGEQR
jgi:hypothetical protein